MLSTNVKMPVFSLRQLNACRATNCALVDTITRALVTALAYIATQTSPGVQARTIYNRLDAVGCTAPAAHHAPSIGPGRPLIVWCWSLQSCT